jgi:hypothetical protein
MSEKQLFGFYNEASHFVLGGKRGFFDSESSLLQCGMLTTKKRDRFITLTRGGR